MRSPAQAAEAASARKVEGDHLLNELMQNRGRFRAFLRQRVNSDADVDDLLQHALIKAMRRREAVRENEKIVAWFYRLLRRALIDYRRSESARLRRDDTWQRERAPDEASTAMLCVCLNGLLPKLNASGAELVRRVDLEGESVSRVAADLGVTPNAAMVALHRARGRLRRELVAFCGECSNGACLDCECEPKRT